MEIKKLTSSEVETFGFNPDVRGTWYGIPDVGCFRLVKRGWVMTEIRNVLVIESERNKGYGKKLLKAAVEFSKTPACFLTIRVENEPCIRASKKTGFKKIGEITSPKNNKVFIYMFIK